MNIRKHQAVAARKSPKNARLKPKKSTAIGDDVVEPEIDLSEHN